MASTALIEAANPLARRELSDQARQIAATLSERSISATLLTGGVRLFEFIAISVLGFVIYAVYVVPVEGVDGWYALPIFLGAGLALVLIQAADGYTIPAFRTHVSQIGRNGASWTLVFAFFAVAAFLTKTGAYYSRGLFLAWYVVSSASSSSSGSA